MVAVETPHDSFRKVLTHPLLQGCVLVALSLAIALSVQLPDRFPDPDSAYHAAMAELAAGGVFPTHFPWLDLTTLRDHFADLHLVYHLLLVPAVAWLGPMPGIRLATIAAFVLLTLTWWVLLRRLALRGAFVWTLLLIGTSSFVFRMNLAKAQGVALVLLALGLIALSRRSTTGVTLAAMFATWTSTHWPVYAVAVATYACSHVFATVIGAPRDWRALLRAARGSLALVVSAAVGIAAAFIVNPYFPGNLAVVKQQVWDIAVVAARGAVDAGIEWAPLTAGEFLLAVGHLLPLLAVAAGGAVMLLVRLLRRTDDVDRDPFTRALAWNLLAFAFAILALRQQRHLEFFVPFAVLAAATGWQPVIAWLWPPRVQVGWRRPGNGRRALASLGLVLALVAFAIGAVRGIRQQRGYFAAGYPATYLRGTADWIGGHARPGAIVFHANWGDFPFLFLANRDHRYLVGLDPMFAALADRERYQRWRTVGRGEVTPAAVAIRNDFHAEYAIVTKTPGQAALDVLLAKDPDAKAVYEDAEAKVYALSR